jgi:hypothetical protein
VCAAAWFDARAPSEHEVVSLSPEGSTMNSAPIDDLCHAVRNGATDDHRRILVKGAHVATMDPALPHLPCSDVLIEDGRIVAVGPDEGVLRAGRFDHPSEIIDAMGAYAVPLTVDSAVAQRPASQRHVYDVIPGNCATFALVRRAVGDSEIRRMLVIRPADLAAVYVSGHAEARDGRPTRPAGADVADASMREKWVGTWEDPARALEQHLLADGRYSETRNGRAGAFTGRYWVRDDRITYLDDSGFWAFGEQLDGTLHHAGFTMNRQ